MDVCDDDMRPMGNDKLLRHNGLWFDDGNVVFRAQNTMFRVHKSILSRESAFFRDMFSLPQSGGDKETFEGCPLVDAQDDADDIARFLSVIFDAK